MEKQLSNFAVQNAFCTTSMAKWHSASVQDYLNWLSFIDFINSKRADGQAIRKGTDIWSYYGLQDGHSLGTSDSSLFSDEGIEIISLDMAISMFGIETEYEDDYVVCYDGKVHEKDDVVLLSSSDSAYFGAYAHENDVIYVEVGAEGNALFHECSVMEYREQYFVTDRRHDLGIHWSDRDEDWLDEDDEYVCNGIYDRYGNEGWFRSEDYVYTYDTGRYYPNGDIAESNGCWYNESDDEWYENSRNNSQAHNASYHSLERKMRCDLSYTAFRVGFEIEKEDSDAGIIDYSGLYDDTDWIKESDGSLDSRTGYELISPTFSLFTKDLENDINASQDLITLINAKASERCGGHINLSARDYHPEQLFEGLSGFFPLLYSIYENRLGKSYCQAKKKHEYYRGDKYSAVYIKSHLVEFRIFPAVKSVRNLLWRRDLIRIMCNNINADEVAVVKMMATPTSPLYKHLRKIFTQEQVIEKIGKFVDYANFYSNKKIDTPKNINKLKDKKDNLPNVDGSVNELGA